MRLVSLALTPTKTVEDVKARANALRAEYNALSFKAEEKQQELERLAETEALLKLQPEMANTADPRKKSAKGSLSSRGSFSGGGSELGGSGSAAAGLGGGPSASGSAAADGGGGGASGVDGGGSQLSSQTMTLSQVLDSSVL